MNEAKPKKLAKRHEALLSKMRGGSVLHCEASQTEEARKGGGFLWWLEPGGKPVSPVTTREIAASERVRSRADGLLAGTSQSFEVR